MAHSTVRFAAGAGVVAASLLIVGPNPAQAVADKHGSGNHIDDYRKNRSSGYPKGGVSNWVNDMAGIGNFADPQQDSKSNLDPPLMDLGAVGSDPGDLAVVSSYAAGDQAPALRAASIAEPPAGDNVSAAAPRPGSRYSGQSVTSFRAPRVVVGNGRTPGAHTRTLTPEAVLSYDSLDTPEAVPAAPAVPEAIEIDIPPLPPLPPVEQIRSAELVVGEFATGTADTVTDPLAGVAGLILIPAIGAVLGYRQARAAQSLRESLRS
ncbi:MAG: hypothetical protein ACXVGO_00250 [Mycobacterium sp.]